MASQGRRDLTHLCRELKAPSLLAAVDRIEAGARRVVALRGVLGRVSGARSREPPYPRREARVKGARFPQIKTLEDFDVSCQRSVRKDIVVHLGTLDFVEAKDNVMFLGPPGTGATWPWP
jgi:DNA replication protein DnaC